MGGSSYPSAHSPNARHSGIRPRLRPPSHASPCPGMVMHATQPRPDQTLSQVCLATATALWAQGALLTFAPGFALARVYTQHRISEAVATVHDALAALYVGPMSLSAGCALLGLYLGAPSSPLPEAGRSEAPMAVAAIGTSPHGESQWFSSRRKCRLLVPR